MNPLRLAALLILALAANTSFADFPRLSSFLARDGYLPRQFAFRGERLAFTTGIVGWSREESQALLGYLCQHAVKPQFVHRFSWRPGSMAIWDNRCTWHNAMNDYHGHRRLMHRITLDGVPLSA